MFKMVKVTALLVCIFGSSLVNAEQVGLKEMDTESLREVMGQGGVDLSVQLRLNLDATNAYNCTTNFEYCRLALHISNRYVDGSNDSYAPYPTGTRTPSPTGAKQWIVFKGVHGEINLQKLGIDGVDLTTTPYSAASPKAALKFSFDPLQPLIFKNFGFESLANEADLVAQEGPGNVPGYLAIRSGSVGSTSFSGGKYTVAGFDNGREIGFMGLNINAALSMGGSIKMFSCDSSHPRCV